MTHIDCVLNCNNIFTHTHTHELDGKGLNFAGNQPGKIESKNNVGVAGDKLAGLLLGQSGTFKFKNS